MKATKPSRPPLKAACCLNEIDVAVRRATFRHVRSGWRCKAHGFEALGLGKTKSEARTNLRNLLVLSHASGVGVDKRRREVRKTTRKRRTSDGIRILNHIAGKSKRMKRLTSEEENALGAERQKWERITQRLGGLIFLKRIKKHRGESTAQAIRRLIGSRTDEQIERMLYELGSGEPG